MPPTPEDWAACDTTDPGFGDALGVDELVAAAGALGDAEGLGDGDGLAPWFGVVNVLWPGVAGWLATVLVATNPTGTAVATSATSASFRLMYRVMLANMTLLDVAGWSCAPRNEGAPWALVGLRGQVVPSRASVGPGGRARAAEGGPSSRPAAWALGRRLRAARRERRAHDPLIVLP